MKRKYNTAMMLFFVGLLFFSTETNAQLTLPTGSQKASVTQTIGISEVTITYFRPSVRDREIWGSLVPYGMNNLGFGTAKESPWRAGANENTVITFSHDAQIEGQPLPAGTYGLHMIVNEDDSATVIFSKNSTAWGSYFYDPSEDALRVDVQTTETPHTEQLTYSFVNVEPRAAVVALDWEKKRIPFTVEFDVTNIVLTDIREKLQSSPGFNRQTWEQAANFALNNGGDLDEALGWVDAAIEGQFFSQKNFTNLAIKARILEKQGKTAAADAVMEEAMALGTVFEIHGYGRQLIAQGQKEKAMEVFKKNAKMHKGSWPVDFGLARGYAAMGNYKTALKHLKIAEGRAPDQLNKDAITGFMVKLENNEDIN
ncbi:DUF2911 domain-containing protein [Flavobacteriaceae bacterium TP-CH-4]|uniref:DUF2911 domain-containing protein n=1 Tax=Pelagihabitans pacificus TaxID=2696054 RepID=A0A967AYU8_9FLAO|nr:DUF2911 domain-containing protein [Pelagihabitans pacificus]NHF60087.1 DUF2911 domain-containing protein [Pelagihabitans pacificus]